MKQFMEKAEKEHKCVDWYRAHNPAGYDLADVTDDSNNPLLGIMAILIEPCKEMSYKVCEVDLLLVGATITIPVFQTKGRRACVYLGIAEDVELNYKVQAQILRYVEKVTTEAYGAKWD